MAATAAASDKTQGSVVYTWTITQDDSAVLGVPCTEGWHSVGPDAAATGTWSLKWQWSPNNGTNWYDISGSTSTAGTDGIKMFRFSPGVVRPHVSGHSSGTIVAVFR